MNWRARARKSRKTVDRAGNVRRRPPRRSRIRSVALRHARRCWRAAPCRRHCIDDSRRSCPLGIHPSRACGSRNGSPCRRRERPRPIRGCFESVETNTLGTGQVPVEWRPERQPQAMTLRHQAPDQGLPDESTRTRKQDRAHASIIIAVKTASIIPAIRFFVSRFSNVVRAIEWGTAGLA